MSTEVLHISPMMQLLERLQTFKDSYYIPHGWVSVVLCSIGVLTNAMNIVVLTRPRMINGVNLLLSFIALCDGALMTSQLSVAIYSRILFPSECRSVERYQYGWVVFFIIHTQFGVWSHATSLWLAVVLSCTRYFTLKSKKTSICTQTTFTKKLSLLVGLLCVVISTPMFLLYEAVPFRAPSDINVWNRCCYQRYLEPPIESPIFSNCTEGIGNSSTINGNFTTLYAHNRSRFYTETLLRLILWTMGILHKIAPCALLLVFVVLLIRILVQVDRRRQRLLSVRNGVRRQPGILNRMQSMVSVRGSVSVGNTAGDRTTAMLIMVVSIFILCELPQGVLYVLMAIFGQYSVFAHIYFFCGDLIDMLSILNSSVNFVLYCLMSAKFRTVFVETFGWRRFRPDVTHGLRLFNRNALIEAPSQLHHQIYFEPRSILVRHSEEPERTENPPHRKCNSAPTSPPYCNNESRVDFELIIEAEDSALL